MQPCVTAAQRPKPIFGVHFGPALRRGGHNSGNIICGSSLGGQKPGVTSVSHGSVSRDDGS
eukprot:3830416-Prymnesium_polylepis.1